MTDHRKTAVYIRLSAEDDNVDGRAKKESDSVTSQRILLKSFVIDELGVAESDILEYVDDGVSGTHFKRQGFQQLQDDMKSGEIGCVVVVIRQIKRCRFHQIKTGLSEHLTMG